jgi:deoxyribodipyrimidine photolyase-related protein
VPVVAKLQVRVGVPCTSGLPALLPEHQKRQTISLILVLGDQLTDDLLGLRMADPSQDIVVMAKVMADGGYIPHHPQKIALVLTAMRKFALRLQARGFRVAYSRLNDAETGPTLPAELMRRMSETGADEIIATSPGDWRLFSALNDAPVQIPFLPDDRFLCPPEVFSAWAKGRKSLRMEWFYRNMRRRTGLLMNKTEAAGGQWSFDLDSRKPAAPGPAAFCTICPDRGCAGHGRGPFPHPIWPPAPFSLAHRPN